MVTMHAERGPEGEPRRPERQPLWRADFAHQAGSLEAVVASTRRRNLFVSSSVLLLLGASIGMLVISNARARTLAAQQMEFVAGVSHELRTPLAVIRSAAENLADGVVADKDQVQRYGQLIAGEGRRLTEMVEQVMEFAGFDAGRTLDVRPVAAVEVVQAAIDTSGPLLSETDTRVDFETPDGPLLVRANHAALARSVQNLISNAVKYGGIDRWVGVRIAPADGRMVGIAVSDHGTGIPESDVARIFEPFYRGQHAVDGGVHGSGLGLSLVDRIVRQHGGRVQVHSTSRGTTFTLLIPAAPEATATAPAVADATLDRHRCTPRSPRSRLVSDSARILLVEDEPGLQLTLSDRLRGEGYEVDTAADGQSGLDKAATGEFDLVLLDVMLPRKNGFDVLRDLRQRGLETPVIMLTARGQVVDTVVGLKLGADDYLSKPFEMMELLARIEARLRRRTTPPATTPISEGYQFGEVRMDFRSAEVFRGTEPWSSRRASTSCCGT